MVTVNGALYNSPAVKSAKGLAYLQRGGVQEVGWRVPTDADLQALSNALGGNVVAGGKLKEGGVVHWNSPNVGADNSSGATALGAGMRGGIALAGVFANMKAISGMRSDADKILYLNCNDATVVINSVASECGYSVRLVRDASNIPPVTDEEMKYITTTNLNAGITTDVITALTTDQEPYSIMLLDADGNDVTSLVGISMTLVGGVWVLHFDTINEYIGIKIKIIY